MTRFFAQKALTGFATFAIATASTALPGTDAKAAPLLFDCYSRSTSDLLMKSALDLSNEHLACLANGSAQVSYQPAPPQTVYVQEAPAPSAGGSFFGSLLGGALGSALGNALSGGQRTERHDNHRDRDRDRENNNTAEAKPSRKVTLPGGVTPNVINPVLRKPITIVQNPSNPAPNPGGRLGGSGIPGSPNLGGIKIPGPGKLSGRLPF